MPLEFPQPLWCLHLSAYTITIITTTATPAAMTSSNEHLYSAYRAHIHELSTLHLLTNLILRTISFYA